MPRIKGSWGPGFRGVRAVHGLGACGLKRTSGLVISGTGKISKISVFGLRLEVCGLPGPPKCPLIEPFWSLIVGI